MMNRLKDDIYKFDKLRTRNNEKAKYPTIGTTGPKDNRSTSTPLYNKPKTPKRGEYGMSLNPIVALSEQFQKLINEHGSAAILRDHLALFKDQVLMLEKENLRLINESGINKISEDKFKSDIDHLEKENEILRDKIQKYEQGSQNELLNNSRMKWGCLVFEGDDKLYCPPCFHKNGKKIETSRVNSKARYCTVCKSNLPSG